MIVENINNSVIKDSLIKDGFVADELNNNKFFKCFSSVDEEYHSIRRGVGLRIQFDNAIILLTGVDVLDYLHRVSTNDLKDLPISKIAKTVFTSDKGRILDLVEIVNLGEKKFLLGNQNTAALLTRWIDKFVIMDDVHVKNLQNEYIIIELIGPQSDSFITLLFGKQVETLEADSVKEIFFDISNIYVCKHFNRNGEGTYKIILKQNEAVNLINYAVSNKGLFDFHLIGEDAFKIFSIEEGIFSSNELNDLFNPLEAKLNNFISFTKGCYIGQEVIARLDSYDKVQKLITGIELEKKVKLENGSKVFDEQGNEAGTITSSICDCERGKMIGLAYIKKGYIGNGNILSVYSGEEKIAINIKEFPLI
jgi:folate-binding protein YgfZ